MPKLAEEKPPEDLPTLEKRRAEIERLVHGGDWTDANISNYLREYLMVLNQIESHKLKEGQ